MSPLLDHDQLALWYRQAGQEPGLFDADRQWAIGDATGASVGTVFVDGDFLDLPDYWVREADGRPAIGIRHADGVLAGVGEPTHPVVWGDGTDIGVFHDGWVHWQGQAVARFQVDSGWKGTTAHFHGAWLWDPADEVVATVGHMETPAGAYLQLTRTGSPDECLRWCSLALLLVARERIRRDEAQAARARHRRRQRHHRH